MIERFRRWLEENSYVVLVESCGFTSADDDQLLDMMAEASEIFSEDDAGDED